MNVTAFNISEKGQNLVYVIGIAHVESPVCHFCLFLINLILNIRRFNKKDSPGNVQIVNYFIQDIVRVNQPLNILEYLRPARLEAQEKLMVNTKDGKDGQQIELFPPTP